MIKRQPKAPLKASAASASFVARKFTAPVLTERLSNLSQRVSTMIKMQLFSGNRIETSAHGISVGRISLLQRPSAPDTLMAGAPRSGLDRVECV
jgi:hypothetical protein